MRSSGEWSECFLKASFFFPSSSKGQRSNTARLEELEQFFAVWVDEVCWFLSIFILGLHTGTQREKVPKGGIIFYILIQLI